MNDPWISRSTAMTEFDSEKEEDEPGTLRNAAVEALQRAARQTDPKEFDRLTRYGLALIERARTIRHRRQRAISETEDMVVPSEHSVQETQETEEPRSLHKLMSRLIAAFRRAFSWKD